MADDERVVFTDEEAAFLRHARFGELPPRVLPDELVELHETDPRPVLLGTAFARLPGAPHDALRAALAAEDWSESAARLAGERTNAIFGTAVDPAPRRFHDRPIMVVGGSRFATALVADISDQTLRERPLFGSVDQWADSTDVLSHVGRSRAAARGLDGAERGPNDR
ncbi:hypothetical protein [Asanoa sp. NPDC050611]|uniref:hypothetical protein n=1 Tax=Asanoa sp. NPDC050611 TaxID=3157098 RepID=UPI0033CC0CD7